MSVTRIWEAPRVTLPYTEAQWAAIDATGSAVDARLQADDVRLTQGGEPTFVSFDDRDGAEWNTEAMGPTKLGLSAQLMERLRARYGAGGLLHHGQGKWYPGEQLPRWSLNLYWRRDGEPMWATPALLAPPAAEPKATDDDARRLIEGIATRLGISTTHAFPAFEDTWYYLWREQRLPSNVDPLDARLSDPHERDRLRRVFEQGLDRVLGYGLPVMRNPNARGRPWLSSPWFLRGGHCYLVPGDSPMGWRLPLASQPWVLPDDYPWVQPPDPFAADEALPTRAALDAEADGLPAGEAAAARLDAPATVVRTALCVEARQGRLYVFMPPTSALDDYLGITAAVEAAATELGLPLVVEGYEPPKDPRLARLSVTPDPGVIEVNVQPASSWEQLVEQTTYLYDRHTRRGCRPRSSCSMAAIPAPAAATISCSAVPRRPTARSCAGPICCAAWSRTGTTTRHFAICSRDCSSGRPARRRASTKRATTRSTKSRSRWPSCAG